MSVGVCLVCVYRRIPWYPIRIRLGYETCVEYDRIHVSSDTRVYPAKFVSLRIREFPRIHVFVSVSYTYSNITGYEQRPARIWDTAYEKDTKRIRVSQHVFGIQKGYMYPEYEPGAVRILPNLYPCVSRLYPRISEDTCIRFCILYVS